MICLEVSLNGSVLCTAGNELGSVHAFIEAEIARSEISLRELVYRPPSTGEDLAPKLKAALQRHERPASMHSVYWIDRKQLKVGDEITIRLVDLPVNDPAPNPDATSESI